METFDAIVVGLGAHGSAAAAALARRGQRVLGLERFGPGEGRGSSGGWTRMIRLSHFEHPWLVPMAAAAWDGWRALEVETNQSILTQTGGLYAGPAGSSIVSGAAQAAVTSRSPNAAARSYATAPGSSTGVRHRAEGTRSRPWTEPSSARSTSS